MIRYIKTSPKIYPTPTGYDINNAIGWTDVVSENNTYAISNDSSNYWRYFVIKLNAGTKYTIRQTERSFDTAFWIYNSDKNVITAVDDDSPSKPSSDGRIDNDGQNETFYYTPTTSGVYYLRWGSYSSGTGTATIEITPKPENHTMLKPIITPSSGFDKWGFLKKYTSTKLAKIIPTNDTNDEYSKLFIAFNEGIVDTAKGNSTPITLDVANVAIEDGCGVFTNNSKIKCNADSWNISTQPFTLEFYINMTTMPTSNDWNNCSTIFVTYDSPGSSDQNALRFGNTLINWQYNDSSYYIAVPADYIKQNTWHHFALVRNGNEYYIFIDGKLRAWYTNTRTVTNYSRCMIGYESSDENSFDSSNAHFIGKLKNLNFSIGIARYLEDFKPFAISGIYTPPALTQLVTPMNLTSNDNDDWTISASSVYDNTYEPYKAFDGGWPINDGGWFSNSSDTTPTLTIQYKKGKLNITSYDIDMGFDSTNRAFNGWKFEGSNNNSNWITLDEVTDFTFNIKGAAISRTFNNNEYYAYYRLVITDKPVDYISISEFRGYGKKIDL